MAEGVFDAVAKALEAGACRDALAALKAASPSAPAWEALLWLGRIEEKRGRFPQAEEAFRRAAEKDAKAEPELRRFFQEEAFLARRKARLEGLLARGRGPAAARELAASLSAPGKEDEASLIAQLLLLVEAGLYPPALERALLGRLARAKPEDKLAREWPQVFSALMCAARYEAAFRLGEAVLDAFGRIEAPGQLMWPWWRTIRRAVAEDRFIDAELERIRKASAAGRHPHWFAYYRAILLSDASRGQEKAVLEYDALRDLDPARYSWMLQSFVLVKLGVPDYAGAIAISRRILDRSPGHWWVRCRMAEAYLASGDVAQGLRELDEAERTCETAQLGEVLTWHGEALLWLGEYARSLEKLDAAVALGAKTFVFGWRGAARLKSGDAAGALEDLDRAVAHDPKDFEAAVWRVEALRALGRRAEARAEADRVILQGPRNYWAHIGRALLRDELGDAEGMAGDFSLIPPDMLAFLTRKLGLEPRPGAPSRARMRRILSAALDWAGGIRRWEKYVQPIWMERL